MITVLIFPGATIEQIDKIFTTAMSVLDDEQCRRRAWYAFLNKPWGGWTHPYRHRTCRQIRRNRARLRDQWQAEWSAFMAREHRAEQRVKIMAETGAPPWMAAMIAKVREGDQVHANLPRQW